MYHIIKSSSSKIPIKAWTKHVPSIEKEALHQLHNITQLPIVHSHVAVMPDVHYGIGATVGSVIATKKAVIPAAVGVDIGCGMCAVKTSLHSSQLPDSLRQMREAIEQAVPHGRTHNGRKGDKGSWSKVPQRSIDLWKQRLEKGFSYITERYPELGDSNNVSHLGTLGTGNHFIEVCLDTEENVWVMLHSGSRGIGNSIGRHFIDLAKKDMRANHSIADLPDEDLAYLNEGTKHFDDYWFAVKWAQEYASINRQIMMERVLDSMSATGQLPEFRADLLAVNCHHNYVQLENHFGEDVYLTRKGAVSANKDQYGIIPGSMGARSYIVRGLGNPDSFHSCSHGAGRVLSRTEAKKKFSIEDQIEQTRGVECRKDRDVIDGKYSIFDPILLSLT